MSEWALFAIGIALTVGTGIFVAAEFSLVALDRQELIRRRELGEKGLGSVISSLKITSTHLSSAQLGITLTTLLAGYTLEPAISGFLGDPLAKLGLAPEASRAVAAVIAVFLATLLSMIIGELVPKNFALARPLHAAKAVIPFQAAFTWVMKPIILVLNGSANRFLRLIGIEPKEELSGTRTAQELSALVRHSASAGMLEADTATLLDKALRFTERSAIDVMTPRLKVITLNRSDSAQDILDLSRKTGFSKFPIIGDDKDDIVGITHLKKAIAVPREKRAEVPAQAVSEEAPRVPETMPLDQLLATLRNESFQLAVVVDEYGGTSGIVTLEDLVEELVGEVTDEHDRDSVDIIDVQDMVSFPADLRPDEVLEQTGISLPESPHYETAAGFVLSSLGVIPEVGDRVRLENGDEIEVEALDGHRIERLRYWRATEADPEVDEVEKP